ncbi:MAG TPA: TfoX/Sxy family protein, partial [Candidatus Polarisedimenticolia bacterium]|nr:TfoX/Sxy family protein [Candidatus Polarisedimenticolia bacterium]
TLAGRIRRIIGKRRGAVEKKMFGGLAFMLDGRMCCGIIGRDLMVRVGPERYEEALAEPHTRPMDFTGRPLTGFVYVAPAGYESDAAVRRWIGWGVAFVSTLPAKRGRRKGPGTPRRGR